MKKADKFLMCGLCLLFILLILLLIKEESTTIIVCDRYNTVCQKIDVREREVLILENGCLIQAGDNDNMREVCVNV